MAGVDHTHMAQALRLAERGWNACEPNPRVGCLIVAGAAPARGEQGTVVGCGHHAQAGGPHAEVVALAEAGQAAAGATAYVTLEPCCHHGRTPPCTEALIDAGIRRVVAATTDPFPAVAGKGVARLQEAGIDVITGVMQRQARQVNRGFFSRVERERPFVTVKLATSLDGATAMGSGESRWITGPAARRDVHRRRARSGALLTGIGTVLADNPSLTVRDLESGGVWRQPLRVVLDRELRTPPQAAMLGQPGQTLVMHGEAADRGRAQALAEAGAELQAVCEEGTRLSLPAVLRALAARGVNELLVEAGATLNGAMLDGGLVDEIVWYLAPHVMGDNTLPAWTLPAVAAMSQRHALAIRSVRAVGDDLRVVAMPHEAN
jgi:diaminohydroxyphosphoribosylaminopyrimidine deaminase/5-amino-6-(5-phosphoribosylamino)uracil reductase